MEPKTNLFVPNAFMIEKKIFDVMWLKEYISENVFSHYKILTVIHPEKSRITEESEEQKKSEPWILGWPEFVKTTLDTDFSVYLDLPFNDSISGMQIVNIGLCDAKLIRFSFGDNRGLEDFMSRIFNKLVGKPGYEETNMNVEYIFSTLPKGMNLENYS